MVSTRIAALTALALLFTHGAPGADEVMRSQEILERLQGEPAPPRMRGLVKVPESLPVAAPSVVFHNILFEHDSSALTPLALRQVDELGHALASPALGSAVFEVAGHTDAVGDYGYNQTLSLRRAESVVGYLTGRFGIEPWRLRPVGYGPRQPVAGHDPYDPVNRRVEIRRLDLARN